MKHIPHNVEFWHPLTTTWMVWEQYPSRTIARENRPQIEQALSDIFKVKPVTSVVATHRSQSPKFDRQASATPPAVNKFSYFFGEHPEVLTELARLGIKFAACEVVAGEEWPALLLPSGKILAIAEDPEGNGPGAIHIFDKE